jgi:hypothetical protein
LLAGLKQVYEEYVMEMFTKKPNLMAAVWRSVKEFDIDKNGFLFSSELESCFKEHFPAEMESKSLVFMFRKYSSEQDKNLINYRKLKS